MFDKFFNKKEKKTNISSNILVAALLIHAAKIDERYTDVEKKIIKEAIKELGTSSQEEIEKIFINAEEKEKESNQIVEFTREIKKNPIEFRLKIIEILWKIVYSDGANDNYESNLIIHPDECIDCGVCEPECPVNAIEPDTNDTAKDWIDINKKFSVMWPNITKRREEDVPKDQEKWRNVENKLKYLSEKPGKGD